MAISLPSRTSVRSGAKKLGWFVAGLAALQIVLFGLLVVGETVPEKPIIDKLAAAVRTHDYGPSGMSDRMGGISDTFTECVVAGTGLGSPDTNPFSRAVFMPRISNCQAGAKQILTLASGQQLPEYQVTGYFKYWAGYTVITRPALALFGLAGMRIIAGAMLLLTGAAAVGVVAKRASKWAAAALLLPMLAASNVMSTPSTSFSQAISISVIFLGIALTAWAASKSLAWTVIGVSLSAALFCFVDLLTTPAIPWAFCTAVAAGVVFARTRATRDTVVAGAVTAVVWPVVFAVTWASRWLIAAVFLGFSKTVDFIRENVDFRSSGAHSGVKKEFGAPTEANWNYWIGHVPTSKAVLVGVLVAVIAALAWAWFRHGPRRAVTGLLISLAAVVVPVWYEALNNHSQIHAFFTYRGVPAMLGVVLFASVLVAVLPGGRRPEAGEPAVPTETGEAPLAAREHSGDVETADQASQPARRTFKPVFWLPGHRSYASQQG